MIVLVWIFFYNYLEFSPFFKGYKPWRGNFPKFMQRRYQNKGGELSKQGKNHLNITLNNV